MIDRYVPLSLSYAFGVRSFSIRTSYVRIGPVQKKNPTQFARASLFVCACCSLFLFFNRWTQREFSINAVPRDGSCGLDSPLQLLLASTESEKPTRNVHSRRWRSVERDMPLRLFFRQRLTGNIWHERKSFVLRRRKL